MTIIPVKAVTESYYLRNKDVLLAKQNQYYQTNKDKINENRRNGKKVCECGSSIPKYLEKRHYYTKKHQNYIERCNLYLESIKFIYSTSLINIHDEPGPY